MESRLATLSRSKSKTNISPMTESLELTLQVGPHNAELAAALLRDIEENCDDDYELDVVTIVECIENGHIKVRIEDVGDDISFLIAILTVAAVFKIPGKTQLDLVGRRVELDFDGWTARSLRTNETIVRKSYVMDVLRIARKRRLEGEWGA